MGIITPGSEFWKCTQYANFQFAFSKIYYGVEHLEQIKMPSLLLKRRHGLIIN